MNKLITILGASGVGKTTLAKALHENAGFDLALEEHVERPFQSLFKKDRSYAFVNQLDYLIYRAEQERRLRNGNQPALMDGGLDLDFHGFTRLFHAHGWLNDDEFELCRRFYLLTRSLLPLPDLIVILSASTQTIRERLACRNRINIASSEDAELVHNFLDEWLAALPAEKVLRIDTNTEGVDYADSIELILRKAAVIR